ncbi:aldo/keto reductase [Rhodocyclus tenuis]|uniref:NADP-dependent oxidoreductase domain-containing protein n=1 Tax=Rhodocyclus tenuis TaxID=1066 RepID=A0A840GEL3_RHOTE|nr:aldo/keto reductase [Rhodocyclus tenuis]MBB4246659.1 hypothetical protein [Rhodocyclus tenuis]
MPSRLALGTVQFGLDYGVANRDGRPALDEVARILEAAAESGIDTLDTAIAYGESEARLGAIGVAGWKIVTKLPAAPADCTDLAGWVVAEVEASLRRLRVDRVHAVLLHRPEQLLGTSGPELIVGLQRLKNDGLAAKTGVSIYAPDELDALFAMSKPDLVQSPLSLFDHRLLRSGWIERLGARGVEVHTRSAFLQGLLLLDASARPAYFNRWQPLWQAWDDWLRATRLSPLQACVRYALSVGGSDRVVVGVDSVAQLRQIVAASEEGAIPPPAWPDIDDADLLNPAHWKLS